MEQELWEKNGVVVIAYVFSQGHIEVENQTFYNYQDFLIEMQRYGYKPERNYLYE